MKEEEECLWTDSPWVKQVGLENALTCDGVIDMLNLRSVWNWHAYRNFPLFAFGSEIEKAFYCHSRLSLKGVRKAIKWYDSNLNEFKYPWQHFKHFIIALSNEGMKDQDIMKVLNEVLKAL